MVYKTILQLWKENNNKSGLKIKSYTNKKTFKLLVVNQSKNLAIVQNRGTGLKFYKKFYQLYVLDNPRWERV